jgi:hypothetical protein
MMARRSKTKKLEPVPTKMTFSIPAGTNTNYVDLSQCASILSRKFLRQGLNWAIGGVRVTLPVASTGQAGNAVYISTLQHTWSVSNAWRKAQAHWLKQQNEALADSGSEDTSARYRDFKIYADSAHKIAGEASNLLPVGLGPGNSVGPFPSALVTTASPATGEWEYSQIVIPNDGAPGTTNEYYLMMHGASASGVKGIIDGYALSRAVPTEPDPQHQSVQSGWLNRMFDVGDDNTDVVDNAINKNDNLPYTQNNYPGGGTNFTEMENQCFAFNTNTIAERTYSFGGFTAPCGLLRIDQQYSDDTSSSPLLVELMLVPGDHRGYLAEPMQEM